MKVALVVKKGCKDIVQTTIIAKLGVKSPSVDMPTVGAGGGSIAAVREVTKALRVGPESAGAVPGPAYCGKGGSTATVADVDVVLGYSLRSLAGRNFELGLEVTTRAVQQVADGLGGDLYEAA